MKKYLFYRIFASYIIVISIAVVVLGLLATGQITKRIVRGTEGELSSFASLTRGVEFRPSS